MGNIQLDKETIENIILSAIILIGAFSAIFSLNRALGLMARHLNMPILSTRSVRNVIRYLTLIIATCFILEQFGFHMNTVLAVLGTILGLIAIGFVATWSILSNFLCTFVLILFNPFAIGDEVEIPSDSVAGKVVDITLLFTTLRTPAGEYIHVPNNMFFQKIFKRRLGTRAIGLSHQLRQEKPAD
jgi:small-conductance mechanosensitive channel